MSPIPVVTDHFLAMVVIPSTAADDEGGFVNTWFFRNDATGAPVSTVVTNIGTVLQAFYSDPFGAGGKSVSQLMSPVVDDATGAQLRVYDLGEAAPRTPHIATIGLDAQQSSTPLPNECAIVLSYHSDDPSSNHGTLNRRKRGRLYLGPWGTGALKSYAAGDGDARVHAETLDTIQLAAEDVLGTTEDVTWTQYSRKYNEMNVVTEGFINDAFDTQRRRGFEPTSRILWG